MLGLGSPMLTQEVATMASISPALSSAVFDFGNLSSTIGVTDDHRTAGRTYLVTRRDSFRVSIILLISQTPKRPSFNCDISPSIRAKFFQSMVASSVAKP